MTYCVGVNCKDGQVFLADTRSNAGVDNISTFRKIYSQTIPGERTLTLLTAGNLATTQKVVGLLEERSKDSSERKNNLLEAPSMFHAACIVGDTLREVVGELAESENLPDSIFSGSMILGGQIKGTDQRMFLIYPEGNFIETTPDTPYFQIGEAKYGKPILIRAFDPDLSLSDAAKLLLVSFDSTRKSNLLVGLPVDILIYRRDSLQLDPVIRFEPDNAYYREISKRWGESLRDAFKSLPDFDIDDVSGCPVERARPDKATRKPESGSRADPPQSAAPHLPH